MENQIKETAIIIGAGPAGLTSAYELLKKSQNIKPVIFEISDHFGGIAKTVNYCGNRMDMGGHRFFSKSNRIMQWWENILPLGLDSEKTDKVMLARERLSRIFFLRKFFDYPVTINANTISNLGLKRIVKIGLSYIKVNLFPIKQEKSLEDFFINRFGKELYLTFFKDYTEKVWGVPCVEINPEWGAQRVKGLSITKALLHFLKQTFFSQASLSQKNTETSLIKRFLYPKFGPGQMWEEVAKIIKNQGVEIHLNHEVIGLISSGNKITGVKVKNFLTGEIKIQNGDYFLSTMPVKDLVETLEPKAPQQVLKVAKGLMYRDFITVGLLLKKLKIKNETNIKTVNNLIPDNWIYIQEPDVKIGRLQIFNNWSPFLVKDPNTVWMGLEYFCNQGDELWNKSDSEFIKFAIDELAKIDIIEKENVLDNVIVRVKKAYPAYFGAYNQFSTIRQFIDQFENLFLIGRNGMHKYNNQDHSMLTAMAAVENIINNVKSKDNIWAINAEQNFHESNIEQALERSEALKTEKTGFIEGLLRAMKIIKLLKDENTKLFARYVILAGSATIVELTLLYTLTEFLGIWYFYSAAIACLIGMLLNFLLNKYLNFRNKSAQVVQQFGIFAAVGLIGLAASQTILYFLVEFVGLGYMIARCIALVLVLFGWSFYGHKKLTFNILK